MDNNYFFVDGSSLVEQIRRVWENHGQYKNKKLILKNSVSYFISRRFAAYKGTNYRRFVFYFPKGSEDYLKYMVLPDRKVQSDSEDDIHIYLCGKKLSKNEEYIILKEYVEKNHPSLVDVIRRGEKGIDTQICCDAIQLASAGKLDRLFLCSNDSDFLPLLRVLKTMGTNISFFHLSSDTKLEDSLAEERDSYHYVDVESLVKVFERVAEEGSSAAQ